MKILYITIKLQVSSLENTFLQWERNADDIYLMVIVYRISSSTASYGIQMLEKTANNFVQIINVFQTFLSSGHNISKQNSLSVVAAGAKNSNSKI